MTADGERRRLTRAESRARTRRRILDAAAQAFVRDGYDGASVEAIAESAGYSVGAVYSNFESKEHLFAELLAVQRAQRTARLREALEADVGSEDRLTRLAQLVGEFASGGLGVAAFGGDGPRAFRDPALRRVVVERLRRGGDELAGVVAEWLEREGVAGAETRRAASVAVVAMVQGLARRRRVDRSGLSDEDVRRALGWLLAGIRAG